MAGRIILDLPNPALDSGGRADATATLTYYENGTTTLQSIYSTSDLDVALANPLSCDSAGRFPTVWAPSDSVYSVKWTRGNGTTQTFDDIWPMTGGGSEDTTPEQYGAIADGSTDDSLAIYNATIASAAIGTSVIFTTGKSYRIDGAQALVFGSKDSPVHNISWKSSGGGRATVLVGSGAGVRAIIFRYADGLRSSGIWIKGDNANAAQNLLCIENTSDVVWENFHVSDQTGESFGIVVSEDTSITQSFAPTSLTSAFTLTSDYVSGNTILAKLGGNPQNFAASAVDTATGKITLTGHCLANSEFVQYTESDFTPGPSTITPPACQSGSMPYYQTAYSGLNHSFIYATRYEDANTIRLCLTQADALVNQTTCLAASVTTATDTITVSNHGYSDGNSVVVTSSGGVPSGLTSGNRYWVKKVDDSNFQLRIGGQTGAIVDLTTQGSGTHTFTPWLVFSSGGTTPSGTHNQLRGLGWQLIEGTDFTVTGGTAVTLAGNLAGGIGYADGSLVLKAAYGTACDNIVFRNGIVENMGYNGMELYPKLASKNWIVENIYFENCGTADTSMGAIKGPQVVTGAQVGNLRIKGGNIGFNAGAYNDSHVSGLSIWNTNGAAIIATVSKEIISSPTRAGLTIDDFTIWHDSDFTPESVSPSIQINGTAMDNGPVRLSNFSIHNTPLWAHVQPQQPVRDIIFENFVCIGISDTGVTSAVPIVANSTSGAQPLAFKMRNFFLKQFGFDGTASVIVGSDSGLIENGRFMGLGAGNPGTGTLILTGDQSEVLNVTFDRCNPSSSEPAIYIQDTDPAHSYMLSSSFIDNRATGLVSTLYHTTGATVTLSSSPGVQPVSAGGTGLTSGTSGGIPYFSGSTAMASSAALAANALVIGGGAGTTPGTLAGTSGGIPYFNGANTASSSAALASKGVVVGGGAGAAPTATSQFTFDASNAFLTVKGASSNPPAAIAGQIAEYSAPDSANEAFYFWRAVGNNPAHVFERANGTTGALTNVLDTQVLGRLYFGGYDGTNWATSGGLLRFVSDGDWSGTNHGAHLEAYGTPNGSTAVVRILYATSTFLGPSATTTFGGIYNGVSSATQPSLLPRTADTTTGIGSSGSGIIDVVISGATAGIWTSTGLNSSAIGATTASTGKFTSVQATASLRASTVTALGTSGTVSLDPTLGNVFTCTPSGDITALNAASVPAGQEIAIVFTTSGTTSRTITFNTGFKTTGTLATGTVSAKVFAMKFVSDGTNFNEVSRTTAM